MYRVKIKEKQQIYNRDVYAISAQFGEYFLQEIHWFANCLRIILFLYHFAGWRMHQAIFTRIQRGIFSSSSKNVKITNEVAYSRLCNDRIWIFISIQNSSEPVNEIIFTNNTDLFFSKLEFIIVTLFFICRRLIGQRCCGFLAGLRWILYKLWCLEVLLLFLLLLLLLFLDFWLLSFLVVVSHGIYNLGTNALDAGRK